MLGPGYLAGVPGQSDPGVPPEVPEEFADAYRAAYERAMAEQTAGARHRTAEEQDDAGEDTPDDERWAHRMPRRAGPPREGTHRGPDAGSPSDVVPKPRSQRESRWIAPALLTLIAVTLVVLAYVLGRIFASSLGG